MKISAKIDYACRALLELSLHWPNQTPVQISMIARNQKIPMKFLVHILIHLKQFGYVESVRGKKGGYILVKSPEQIRFSEVLKSFGGLSSSESEKTKRKQGKHILDLIWSEIDDAVQKTLDGITFDVICNRSRTKDKAIMYDI